MQPVTYYPIAQPAAAMTVQERDALILEWDLARKQLAAVKEREALLRRKIVEESGLFDPAKEKGTENYALGNGFTLKATKKLSYNVANSKGEAFAALARLAEMGEASRRVSENLFKFDANLRVGEYNKLRPEEAAIINEILTIKPGMPELELVPPKQPK